MKTMKMLCWMAVISLSLGAWAHADLTTGLIGYWAGENNMNDSSGQGHNGVKDGGGTLSYAAGKVGQAFSFDGNCAVNCGANWDPDPCDVMSISLWMYLTAQEYDGIMAKNNGGKEFALEYKGGVNNRLEFSGSSYLQQTSGAINLSQWYHVVIVVDGPNTDAFMYLDNVKIKTNTNFAALPDKPTSPVLLGAKQSGGTWVSQAIAGRLDEVCLYGRLLSTDEIASLYNNGNGRSPLPDFKAKNPDPAHNAPAIVYKPHLDLKWAGGADVIVGDKFKLFFDPNELALPGAAPIATIAYDPNGMSYRITNVKTLAEQTPYFWRLDTYDAGNVLIVQGDVWKFTTAKLLDITDQPDSVSTGGGVDVVFTVAVYDATPGTPYTTQWFKGDPNFPMPDDGDGDKNKLTLHAVTSANEGDYYCVVTESGGDPQITSDRAHLTVYDDLVAYWPLDGNWTEVIGHRNTYGVGGPTFDPCTPFNDPNGRSASFDGVDDWAKTDNDAAIDPGAESGKFTVECWVYWKGVNGNSEEPSDYQALVDMKYFQSDTQSWALWFNETTGIVELRGTGTSILASSNALSQNAWNYVVATWDHATAKLYVNGTTTSSGAWTYTVRTTDRRTSLGCASGNRGNLFGFLDDVKLYNYALSASTIIQRYFDVTGNYGCSAYPTMDFNHDCLVNLADLAAFAGQWLECNRIPPSACGS